MSILKLTLIGLGSRLAAIGVLTLNTIVLARWLGPAGVGEYFLLLKLVAVLTVLGSLGLNQSTNVFACHVDQRRLHHILLRFTVLTWCATLIVGGVTTLLAGDIFLPNFPRTWIALAFIVLPMSLYASFWNGMMIGRGRIWQFNFVQLLTNTGSLILSILFIVALSGGLLTAVIIYSFITLAQFLIMVGIAGRESSDAIVETTPADLSKEMLNFGLRAYPGSIANLLSTTAPLFLLNVFHGPAAVGIFAVAQQLVERVLLPTQALGESLFRKIATLPRQEALIIMNRYIRLTSSAMTIMAVAGVIGLPWIINFVLGNSYFRTGTITRLLLPGAVITSICILMSVYFLGQLRSPGLLSILGWIHAFLNMVLCLMLIPKLSETGAAWAVVTAQFVSGTCVVIFYLRITQTRLKELVVHDEDFGVVGQRISGLFGRNRETG